MAFFHPSPLLALSFGYISVEGRDEASEDVRPEAPVAGGGPSKVDQPLGFYLVCEPFCFFLYV